jgi:TolB-like protein
MKTKPAIRLFFGVFLSILALSLSQCYSFKGISIGPETETYSVALFQNNAALAPPVLAQTFTEGLKDEIRKNTRLRLISSENEADLAFSGNISGFEVSAQAPQPGQNARTNQLKISIYVEQIDAKDEKNTWKQTFVFQADFPGDRQLIEVQDQLMKEISNKILKDVFNRAFTENW